MMTRRRGVMSSANAFGALSDVETNREIVVRMIRKIMARASVFMDLRFGEHPHLTEHHAGIEQREGDGVVGTSAQRVIRAVGSVASQHVG